MNYLKENNADIIQTGEYDYEVHISSKADIYNYIDKQIQTFTSEDIDLITPPLNNIFTDGILDRIIVDAVMGKFKIKDEETSIIKVAIGEVDYFAISVGFLKDTYKGLAYNRVVG